MSAFYPSAIFILHYPIIIIITGIVVHVM